MLELKDVSFEVTDKKGQKEILNNINLTIDDHKLIVITGPTGSGKSTLAKIIAGIYQPSSGQILLDGEDITGCSITERARKGISYAFQQPVRFKGLTVRDLMSLAAGKEANFAELCDLLSEVGLCAKDYIMRDLDDSLSGGELKRIEIAMALARNAKLSIFDEPEAGIDLWSFSKLIKELEKMVRMTQGNILLISHQERILDIADEIVVIANGTISKQGPKDEILPELLGTASAVNSCDRLEKGGSQE